MRQMLPALLGCFLISACLDGGGQPTETTTFSQALLSDTGTCGEVHKTRVGIAADPVQRVDDSGAVQLLMTRSLEVENAFVELLGQLETSETSSTATQLTSADDVNISFVLPPFADVGVLNVRATLRDSLSGDIIDVSSPAVIQVAASASAEDRLRTGDAPGVARVEHGIPDEALVVVDHSNH